MTKHYPTLVKLQSDLDRASLLLASSDWKEKLHPRANDGRFGAKSEHSLIDQVKKVESVSRENLAAASDVIKGAIGNLTLTAEDRESLKQVTSENGNLQATQKALVVAAGLAGVGIATVVAAKLRYHHGIKKSAKLAKQLAKDIEVPEELFTTPGGVKTPSTHVTVTVGGFDGNAGKDSIHHLSQQLYQDATYKKHYMGQYFTFVPNKDFNLTTTLHPNVGSVVDSKRMAKSASEAMKVMLRKTIKQDYNEDAIRMAATAYAYATKHPDKDINLLGMSAGGMITHTSQDILHELGVKAKVANLGSPWFGLSSKKGASVTISSANDWMMKHLPSRDTLRIDSVWDHLVYQDNAEVQSFLGRFLKSSHEDADDLRTTWNTLSDTFEVGEKDTTGALRKQEALEKEKRRQKLVEIKKMTLDQRKAFRESKEGKAFLKGANPQAKISASSSCFAIDPSTVLLQAGFDWHEKLHPRATNGRFGSGGASTPSTDSTTAKSSDATASNDATGSQKTATKRGFFDNPQAATKAVAEQLRKLQQKVEEKNPFNKEKPKDSFDLVELQKDLAEIEIDPKLKQAVAAGAVALGMPIALFLAQRFHYRQGFKKSAEIASKLAKDIDVGELKAVGGDGAEAKQITLLMGGFARTEGKHSSSLKRQITKPTAQNPLTGQTEKNGLKKVMSDHHVIPVSNASFDLSSQLSPSGLTGRIEKRSSSMGKLGQSLTNLAEVATEQPVLMLKHALKTGRNPAAVDMAAVAIAFHKKFPDKPINLMAVSGGGMVTHEAAMILKEAGIDAKVLNMGSPHYGLANPKNSKTLVSEHDELFYSPPKPKQGEKSVPSKNQKPKRMIGRNAHNELRVDSVQGHNYYLEHPDVHKVIDEFFNAV